MHRLIKPKKTTAPSVVWEAGPEGNKRVSTDQANADAQRRKWTKIWDAHKTPRARIAEKMKGGEDDPGRNRARQTPMRERVDALRATVRAFKRHTAMSHDATKPHLLGEVTDEALEHLIRLYDRCEDEGKWPEAWRHPCLVCIPKEKEGDFRLIALLHFAYRAWAKEAAREVSEWMANLGYDWLRRTLRMTSSWRPRRPWRRNIIR